MLIFGHVGITLGTAITLTGLQNVVRATNNQNTTEIPPSQSSSTVQSHNKPPKYYLPFISLLNRIDIRLLLIGSLLPDIIDKPIGQWLFNEYFSNGRIFSHTLLFLILTTILGLFFHRKYGRTWFLSLSFGTFMHLILDQMWRAPKTLLWPVLGLEFDRIDLTGWIGGIWQVLLTDPAIYIPELFGLFIIIWFFWVLLRTHLLYSFIRFGRLQKL